MIGKIKWNIITLKKSFYSHLNTKQIRNLGEYHNLCVHSNTLLLADVFENFRNMCLEIYEFIPSKFFSALGLAWQEALKKAKVN